MDRRTQQTCTAIVTGATSGIGYELVRLLSQGGWRVIAIGRNQTALAAVTQLGANIEAIAFDLSDTRRINVLVDSIISQHNDVRLLINNAAVQIDAMFGNEGTGPFDIQTQIATNLTTPIALVSEILPFFLDQGSGCVVNISSGLAFVPKRTSAVYSATKAGLSMFSEALRVQLSDTQITIVDAILPLVETPMTQGRGNGKMSANEAAKAIIAASLGKSRRVYIGKARFLPILLRWAPWLARAILQRAG